MLASASVTILSAVPPVEVPEWARPWLSRLGLAMAALFVLWLLTTVLRRMHRRAYNLTKMETAPVRAPEPAFLKVDEEARAEAIARGDAYVRPADREGAGAAPAGPAPRSIWSRWGLFSRIGAVVIALAHVGVAVVSVAAMIKDTDEVVRTVSTADCIRAVVSRYWVGFLLGLIVIIAEAARLLRRAGKKG
jgi:hypothetical protein